MEEIAKIYVIERLEQLRALADPLRARIMERLIRQPMTMSQLGEEFGETTAKMHYHVHELERFGFIKLVEKRERGGFIEKYYRAVAKEFIQAPNLLRLTPTSEVSSTAQEFLARLTIEALKTFERKAQHPDGLETLDVTREVVWLTENTFQELKLQLSNILNAYHEPRGTRGEREWVINFIAHTAAPGEDNKKNS